MDRETVVKKVFKRYDTPLLTGSLRKHLLEVIGDIFDHVLSVAGYHKIDDVKCECGMVVGKIYRSVPSTITVSHCPSCKNK
jgi:hypothetical protein